ncbi:alkaline phosphatase D family protein [Flagellimonas sp. S3867]|uniref:alkaline phosphatase D family protein n=1 Tax=Flagellimonas sp. S3867 TaxID=2768063 RepID=UPI0016830144|nr:alkaline phosphatase D family protein [Flagellimonas sp. S3867]
MKRRNYLKTLLIGAIAPCISPSVLANGAFKSWPYTRGLSFNSNWHNWPNMKWVGPEYWGNRLQDWFIEDGKVICDVTDKNRNLHLLPIQKPEKMVGFITSVIIDTLNPKLEKFEEGCLGLRLGVTGPNEDYRSAAVFGKGTPIGLTPKGKLKIGDQIFETTLNKIPKQFGLVVEAIPSNGSYIVTVSVTNPEEDFLLFKKESIVLSNNQLTGNFSLLSDFKLDKGEDSETPSAAFSNWHIVSQDLTFNADNFFGPICFTQYTLNKGKLKLTAQMAPIEKIEGRLVHFQIKNDENKWETLESKTIEPEGRSVHFSVINFEQEKDIPFRITSDIPLANKMESYYYEGTISKEPHDKNEIKTAVFSCNFHYGFPDADIPANVSKLNPDIILFLGDQFYEGTGGFGASFKGEFDKMCLDYLRKWYMFGWSYRDLYRHRPCAIIPDDHDVYHGNIWGEEGEKADISKGFGAFAQDSGGYKMPAKWVNMVQRTQTGHLPDAYDSSPVKQGIGVYYTHWNYAGISFAILEDRKFKSAPKNVLPKSAKVNNGWIMNDDFDIKEHRDIEADLLGERQHKFLDNWTLDWSNNAKMKVVLSQTNFATVATLPKGAKTGAVIPSLPIPKKGEYIKGDRPTVDMDSNGWPAKGRDLAVKTIRKAFAFHIAGDQHLASFVQYGLKEHGDCGYAFAGPALNNIWPRRFWPDVDSSRHTYENPSYVGEHVDGFGNKMTVFAVANPHDNGKEPKILHNRAVGFGMVTFDKKKRTIKTECWPRFVDPTTQNSQYPGWPITIQQEDNYTRKAAAWLPNMEWNGNYNPVLKVFDKEGQLVYAIRPETSGYSPKVFKKGKYRIEVEVPELGFRKTFDRVKAGEKRTNKSIKINLKG